MPVYMLKAPQPWCVVGGIWFSWLRAHPTEGEAILGHKEFMGRKLGRERILQDLQGSQYLWS